MGLQPGWATASLIGLAASFAVCLLICLFLYFCYFPGGRNLSDVMEVHELSKYNRRIGDEDEDYDVESYSEYGTSTSAASKEQVCDNNN